MSKRRKQNRSQTPQTKPTQSAPAPGSLSGLLNGIQLFLIGTLITARYFVPAESAPQGETLFIALGWFLVAILFSVSRILDRTRVFRLDLFDIGVWLLVSGQVISTLVMIYFAEGQQRAALNMMWEWVALGLTFSIVRRLVATTTLRNAFLQGFLTTIVVLSVYGIWQHHWMYEQLSQEYISVRQELDQANSPSVRSEAQQKLLSMGVPAHALEGSGRLLWENRLLNSSEPLGMFALTNTFAGVLAVGFLIALAQTMQTFFFNRTDRSSKGNRSASWILLLLTMLIGYCLILTKSRTALIGVIGGLVSIGLLKLIQNRRNSPEGKPLWKIKAIKSLIAGMCVLLGLILLATFSGGFDREVLTEAFKSLLYRMEYWTATWDVIQENPLWGTGPGNFREHYLMYKLPGSSEEISDPHNLFLDVWANAGIIALAGLVLVLSLVCYRWISKPISDNLNLELTIESASHEFAHDKISLLLGFLISFPLLWGVQLFLFAMDESVLWVFCLGWLATYAVLNMGWQSIDSSDRTNSSAALIPLALAAAFVTLCIHLLAAGGIAMPAVTQTWLMLLALAFPVRTQRADPASDSEAESRSKAPYSQKSIHLRTLFSMICVLLAVLFVISSFAPTIQGKKLVGEGEQTLIRGQSVRGAQQYFIKAGKADPLSPDPWQALSEIQWNQGTQDRDAFMQGVKLKKAAIQRDPLNPGNYFELGQRFYDRYQASKLQDDLERAISNLKLAINGYPNNARYRALIAEALADAGKLPESREQAHLAISLDEANHRGRHVDKYLSEASLSRLNEIINRRESNQN